MKKYKINDLSEFVNFIINEYNDINLEITYEKLKSYYVEENVLIKLIKKSNTNKNIRSYICDIFEVIDADCISEAILDYIEKYRYKKVRKTILMFLAHKDLPNVMLEQICHNGYYPEAFFKIFLDFISSNKITPSLLSEFRKQHLEYFNDLEEIKLTIDYRKDIPNEKRKCIVDTYKL